MVGIMEVETTIKPPGPFRTREVLCCENLPQEEVAFGGIGDVIPRLHVMIS